MNWILKFSGHICLISLSFSLSLASALADEVYFLDKIDDCQIEMYQDKTLRAVSKKPFINMVLSTKRIPTKPEYVAFKFHEKIFVTREFCVINVFKKDIENKLVGNEYRKKKRELSEREKFNSYKYFIEVDTGLINNLSKSPIVSDYNTILPSSSSVWGATKKSSYDSGALISLGFGFRSSHERFLAFKVRFLNGKKSDPASLLDLNTSLTQEGAWSYDDSFKNFYGGYKYIFRDFSAWKPVCGFYLGLSHMTSTLTNGQYRFEMSSLGIAALLEGGIEYHINSRVGFGLNLGFEYLGSRSMKVKTEGLQDFKTDGNYNNQYLSLGVKYYFL